MLIFVHLSHSIVTHIIVGVETIAGGCAEGHRDGPKHQAMFVRPHYCAVDPSDGSIWVSDAHDYAIRKILPDGAFFFIFTQRKKQILYTGNVITVAGCPGQEGYKDGAASESLFHCPCGIALDPVTKTLFVADSGNNRIRVVYLDGILIYFIKHTASLPGQVETLAGNGIRGTMDGDPADCSFSLPFALCLCPLTNDILVSDHAAEKIRRVKFSRQESEHGHWRLKAIAVETVAGCGITGTCEDGPALSAKFDGIFGIAVCPRTGNILFTDFGNDALCAITPQGLHIPPPPFFLLYKQQT